MSGAQYEELFALLISVCYREVFVGRGWNPLSNEIIRTFDLFVDSLLSISIFLYVLIFIINRKNYKNFLNSNGDLSTRIRTSR